MKEIPAIISFQHHFQAQDTDLILATMPKSGTTWLKALAFAIVNRARYTLSENPLHSCNPHDLVPFFEYKLYANNQLPNLSLLLSPRLLATHIPFISLPESIKKSGCKIVYLCRNPLDTFVSYWNFLTKSRPENLGVLLLDDAFDMFCRGVLGFGPFFDHVLGYWKESLERPHKVLFLKYEDLKEDIISQMKGLAEFLGFPFSLEEEREGIIEGISKLCSFNNLMDLEVNKYGKSISNFESRTLFRRGEVGDWVHHLSPAMVERLNKIMEEKLGGTGLRFKTAL